ncbi:uncharacterized protein [Periplaneta americana]|uniref:uncharacterized protein n=1 Tax=Periplaneta americana TaxID=6978 RepID=UPI0037E82B1B
MEDSAAKCDVCGFLNPDFVDWQRVFPENRAFDQTPFLGRRLNVVYEDIDDAIFPEWLQKELARLFPGLDKDKRSESLECHVSHHILLQEPERVVQKSTFMSVQLQTASFLVQNEKKSLPFSSDVGKPNVPLLDGSSGGGQQRCSFCAKNGETEAMVTSHNLYNPETKVVQCPILRAYRCESCNATGDFAHTRSYCPRIRMLEGNVKSATIALKSTRRQANGMLRNIKTPVSKSPPKLALTRFQHNC